jgi:hypothetical protein
VRSRGFATVPASVAASCGRCWRIVDGERGGGASPASPSGCSTSVARPGGGAAVTAIPAASAGLGQACSNRTLLQRIAIDGARRLLYSGAHCCRLMPAKGSVMHEHDKHDKSSRTPVPSPSPAPAKGPAKAPSLPPWATQRGGGRGGDRLGRGGQSRQNVIRRSGYRG